MFGCIVDFKYRHELLVLLNNYIILLMNIHFDGKVDTNTLFNL